MDFCEKKNGPNSPDFEKKELKNRKIFATGSSR
jgi:hypothetical protein